MLQNMVQKYAGGIGSNQIIQNWTGNMQKYEHIRPKIQEKN